MFSCKEVGRSSHVPNANQMLPLETDETVGIVSLLSLLVFPLYIHLSFSKEMSGVHWTLEKERRKNYSPSYVKKLNVVYSN